MPTNTRNVFIPAKQVIIGKTNELQNFNYQN